MSLKPASYQPQNIRNVVLVGHAGSGKTTLAEAILHRCGAVGRMGSVEQATTVGDHEPEARAHHDSTNSTMLFAAREGREINLIDTPGHPELVGTALAALPAVETAVVVVNAATGIEFNTRRLFHAAGEAGLARMVLVNKIDQRPEALAGIVRELRDAFGPRLHCMNLPTANATDVIDCFDVDAGAADFGSVASVHAEILESAIEDDEETLAKYLGGDKLDVAALRRAFVKAMVSGHVVPILFASAKQEVGIDDLLHILVEEAPSPSSGRARRLLRNGEMIEVACDVEQPFLGHVFKVTSDTHAGRLAMMRVLQGRIDASTSFVCGTDKKRLRAGHVLKVEGGARPELDSVAYAGDLVALSRLDDVHVDTIVHAPDVTEELQPITPQFPSPMVSRAIEAKTRNDDAKLGAALQQLAEEDPTFRFGHDNTTRELVISGLGETHLALVIERLKNRFRIEVTSKAPTIAYAETITGRAEGHHRHKKQTGGAGQFGEVFLRVEPLARGEGNQFVSEVVGGAIPTHFIAAVEKGVLDALAEGPIAGFPVQDVRVAVYDGKTHPVDGKEIAFRTAARKATHEALSRASGVLLEPIVSLEITANEEYLGAITSDLKQARGRVLGVDTASNGMSIVRAQAPLAEVSSYSTRLRASTGGHGTFVMEPSHYEVVPRNQQQRVAAARPQRDETEGE